ncbi:UDP-N-acetylmuramoyl-L-alanyl-D-glutamate--2,6-diaminopimelate ligase [Rothia sp. P5766]|uniref:UDP-N-acetylmuramoyl-L-alanyl-D-glutamate--2, 6-diaminopimelate ligase n=1 Tax=unclassified Rothia (in: high G+C Gram-positive bacteria) TaxID=2689056 RepID=UPI003ADA1F83
MNNQRLLNGSAQTLRPRQVNRTSCVQVAEWLIDLGQEARHVQEAAAPISGITLDSREIQKGDLYVALSGAKTHGATFIAAALERGASAVLTDADGLELIKQDGALPQGLGVIVTADVRAAVGPLSARIYGSQPANGGAPRLFAVTGTNGKTTTTYMINSAMQALGHTTGLIGTIEILAGGQAIPSKLTTPESPHVHSLIALMSEQGISSAAMEVSSHALDYRRVDGIRYDVAGFTNLTQDHLDLHGTMEKYFESKAELFTPQRTRRAVITVDDEWGQKMADRAIKNLGSRAVVRLATKRGAGFEAGSELSTLGPSDWKLIRVQRSGIGHSFVLERGDGLQLASSTQLPADFNVSNAALAALMVFESVQHEGERSQVAEKLSRSETLAPVVPGRMQLISTAPTALVDFAHNPDALKRALEAIEPANPKGKIIIVFGATGERDQTKRPLMGQIAASYADIVIVTDDDPHHEAPGPIREAVESGALAAVEGGARAQQVFNIEPRSAAINRAIELAGPEDSILIAGRGHEVAQDVAGTDLELDDRVETACALLAAGYSVLPAYQNEQK